MTTSRSDRESILIARALVSVQASLGQQSDKALIELSQRELLPPPASDPPEPTITTSVISPRACEGSFGVVMPKPLTFPEVNSLPVGTSIVVIWAVGNGPHEYKIGRDAWGNVFADVGRPAPPVNDLTLVGDQNYHTRVWLAEHVQVRVKDE